MPDHPPSRPERAFRALRLPRRSSITVLVTVVLVGAWFALGTLDRTRSGGDIFDDPIRSLAVEVDRGDVEVAGDPGGDTLRVEWDATWRLREPTVRWAIDDGALFGTATCGRGVPGVTRCRADHRLTVPRRVGLRMTVEAGEVELRDLDADVEVVVGTGAVWGRGLRGDDVVVRAGGGDVVLELAAAPSRVEISTLGGDVELVVPGGPYHVEVSAAGGSVEVDVPTRLDAEPTLTVASDGGSVLVRSGDDGSERPSNR